MRGRTNHIRSATHLLILNELSLYNPERTHKLNCLCRSILFIPQNPGFHTPGATRSHPAFRPTTFSIWHVHNVLCISALQSSFSSVRSLKNHNGSCDHQVHYLSQTVSTVRNNSWGDMFLVDMLIIALPGYTLSRSGGESLGLELNASNSYRLPFAIIYRIIPYAPCAFSCMLARKCFTLCSRRGPGKALSYPEGTAIHSSIARCSSLLLLQNKRMSVSYPIVIPSYGVAMPMKCLMMIVSWVVYPFRGLVPILRNTCPIPAIR
jgi:hypothetical protein